MRESRERKDMRWIIAAFAIVLVGVVLVGAVVGWR
jgi:heme A synthase